MSTLDKRNRHGPLLRVRSHFTVTMTVVRHPVRLTVCLLMSFFLLPELTRIGVSLTGLDERAAMTASVAFLAALVFLPQFVVEALNCKKVSHDFYPDRLVFTESFLLREKVTIPYKSITAGKRVSSALQRVFSLSDIVLTIQTKVGRLDLPAREHRIYDVRDAGKALARIEKILKAADEVQGQPASGPRTLPD